MTWNLTEAKARLSELLKRAHEEGPQKITRHNKDTWVVVSEAEYERLRGAKPVSFKELLLSGAPLDDLDWQRDRSSMRDVTL